MASKRIKISFQSINDRDFHVIDKQAIAQTSERVKVAMKDVVRDYDKNETKSQRQASLLVLNA